MNGEENIPEEKPIEDNRQLSEISSLQQPFHESPQTENMEVHHPHDVTHKKKWTEYSEFLFTNLLLFLL